MQRLKQKIREKQEEMNRGIQPSTKATTTASKKSHSLPTVAVNRPSKPVADSVLQAEESGSEISKLTENKLEEKLEVAEVARNRFLREEENLREALKHIHQIDAHLNGIQRSIEDNTYAEVRALNSCKLMYRIPRLREYAYFKSS